MLEWEFKYQDYLSLKRKVKPSWPELGTDSLVGREITAKKLLIQAGGSPPSTRPSRNRTGVFTGVCTRADQSSRTPPTRGSSCSCRRW